MENQNELQQIRTDMKDMKGKVDKMYYALMGNEIAQDGGLVARIQGLEKRADQTDEQIEAIQKENIRFETYQKIMWGCVGAVAGIVFAYIIQLIFNHLK